MRASWGRAGEKETAGTAARKAKAATAENLADTMVLGVLFTYVQSRFFQKKRSQ